MKAILTIGCSASGKTTWAEEYVRKNPGWININRDDLRFAMFCATGWKDYKFTKEREQAVTDTVYGIIDRAAGRQNSVIISDTNLDAGTRTKLTDVLQNLGYTVELKEFDVPLEELWRRDQFRGNRSVGREVIYKQYQKWLQYKGRKVYIPNMALPTALIVDIDGTLAHMHGRGPYDWHKVHEDRVDFVVKAIVNMTEENDGSVILLSGRDGICRPATERWLKDKEVFYTSLFMRAENDTRKDVVVKEEIFWRDVAPHYNVLAAIDDRPCVARLWREMGIKVLQVGDPHVEF